MGHVQRKYPRMAFDEPADIVVRIRGERVNIPVTIRSLSCEGVGLVLPDASQGKIPRGASIILSFDGGGSGYELPGRVVWSHKSGGQSGSPDVGVRLQLELASYVMRQSYATWVVRTLRSAVATANVQS